MEKKLQMSLIILITALLLSATSASETSHKDNQQSITICDNNDSWNTKTT